MENQQQQQTSMCLAGCGFYGSSATEGLCSKCYRDQLKRQQDSTAAAAAAAAASSATAARLSPTGSQASIVTTTTTTVPTRGSETIAATTSAVMIAEKLREVSCSQAAKSSEDVTAKLESVEASGAAVPSSSASNSPCVLSTSSSVASLDTAGGTEAVVNADGQVTVKKANRCHVCKKRVGLTGFACRCGGLYCGEHRYDTAHGCSFDYKTMEREEIRKNNPMIVSEKIQRL